MKIAQLHVQGHGSPILRMAELLCLGSLITPTWLVSAAHCTEYIEFENRRAIRSTYLLQSTDFCPHTSEVVYSTSGDMKTGNYQQYLLQSEVFDPTLLKQVLFNKCGSETSPSSRRLTILYYRKIDFLLLHVYFKYMYNWVHKTPQFFSMSDRNVIQGGEGRLGRLPPFPLCSHPLTSWRLAPFDPLWPSR